MANIPFFSAWLKWYQIIIIPLYLTMAYGLWTRKEWGRILTIFYFGFGLMKSVIYTATHFRAMHAGAAFSGSLTGHASAWIFSSVIVLGSLVSNALLLAYLLHRQVRQYFQEDSLSEDTGTSALVTGMGYAGIVFLCVMILFPYAWMRAMGGPTVEESKRLLTGGRNQAEIIALMEKRVYPPLAELEKEAAQAHEKPGANMLQRMAKSAYAEGQYAKARTYAEELLEAKSPRGMRGDAIHHGNIILGRLALREGNLNEAKARLLAAGHTPGSPPLDSFGPNMALAEELLEKNERAVVLQYFDLCRRFWKLGKSQLDAWTAAVQKGDIPAFTANLIY